MTVQTVEGFTRQGGGALGNDRKVIEAAFSNEVLQERQNSPPVPIGEDSVVVLRVTDHKPPQQLPLAQVQEQIADPPARGQGACGGHRGRHGAGEARQCGRAAGDGRGRRWAPRPSPRSP